MATKVSSDNGVLVDGSFDWTDGCDSSKVTTIASDLNPNGIKRSQLSWMNNCGVRTVGILQRTGWQPLLKIIDDGRWQGGFIYEPDGANPYLVCSISGHIYQVLLEPPFTITDLSAAFGLFNPPDAEIAFFCSGRESAYHSGGRLLHWASSHSSRWNELVWSGHSQRVNHAASVLERNNAPKIERNHNCGCCCWNSEHKRNPSFNRNGLLRQSHLVWRSKSDFWKRHGWRIVWNTSRAIPGRDSQCD